jgi:hypothetical protein
MRTIGSPSDGIPSLPEDVQLVLALGAGKLRQGWTELPAAALVELALLGRVGSVPENGFLARPGVRNLTVLNDTPTGVPTLDSALVPLAARGKPWSAFSCLKKLAEPVARETQEALIRRGAISRSGRFDGFKTTLSIADEQQYRAAVYRLDTAWLKPEAVTDARSGAFVDLLRNAGEQFSRGASRDPVIQWEWYPESVRDTVATILDAEQITTSASSGGGYEG